MGYARFLEGMNQWSREQGEATASLLPTTRRLCIVDDCDWTYDEPSEVFTGALIGGSIEAHARHVSIEHARTVEAACRAHLETHDVLDFARTIARLRSLVEEDR